MEVYTIMTHPGGRPLKFESVEELQKKIDDYFNSCDPHMEETTEWVEARGKDGTLKKDENGLNYLVEVTHKTKTKQIPYTITGLALALRTSRKVLVEYEDKDEFSNTIKEAKNKCEHFVEQMLFTNSPTGPIFNLKNNYSWKDKTETDMNLDGGMNVALVEFIRDKPNATDQDEDTDTD